MAWLRGTSVVAVVVAVLVLLSGCSTDDVNSSIVDVPTPAPVQGQGGESSEASAAASPSALMLDSASYAQEFKDVSGYTASVKVTLWEHLSADFEWPVTHPAVAGVVFDQPNDFNPAVDLIIPFELTLTNTTDGFSIDQPRIYYLFLSDAEPVPLWGAVRTLEGFSLYSSGWESTAWNVGPDLKYGYGGYFLAATTDGLGPVIEWQQPLGPGSSVSQYGFFVYRDKLTPAEPKGTTADLRHLSLLAHPGMIQQISNNEQLNLLRGPWQ